MVTIYDIAKKANVSPMTVSRVINKSGKISVQTREKVEKIIEELNYIPNSAARTLTLSESKILSLIITDITNPFFTKVARGAEDKAMQMGYRLLLCNSDEDVSKESEYIKMMISSGVDGILFAPAGNQSLSNIKTLTKKNIPFVLIDREIEEVPCDLVLGDSRLGTQKLIQHLIDIGHRRIAIINAPLSISTAKDRQHSYEETLKINGLPINQAYIVETHYKQESHSESINQLLTLPDEERPTAIFAANNFIAVKTIKALREHGLKVPEDIAVVCFDHLEPISDFNPFLTVASQPAYDFGYTGMQLLIERIQGSAPKEARKVVFPPEMVVHKSSLPDVRQ